MGDKKDDKHKKHHSDFRRMVEMAIEDEIAAAARYANMSNMVKNRVLKSLFFNIAGDEYAHARTFMVILQLIDCVEIV